MIVVVEKNENGKIELTKEELEQYIIAGYNDGYDKGLNEGLNRSRISVPYDPMPLEPVEWGKPYCIKTETDPKNANISYTTTTSNGTVTKGIVHDDGKVVINDSTTSIE